MLQELTLLSLGWLAGVLSPILVDKIRAKRELTAVQAALKDELDEIGYRLALASQSVHQHFGTTDREQLQWLSKRVAAYRGKESRDAIQKGVDLQLSWSDDQFLSFVLQDAAPRGKGLHLPKFAMPFADARVPGWHLLPAGLRVGLLAIHGDIRLLNDAADLSRLHAQQTFSKLNADEYESVIGNLAGSCSQYARHCRYAADRMAQLQPLL